MNQQSSIDTTVLKKVVSSITNISNSDGLASDTNGQNMLANFPNTPSPISRQPTSQIPKQNPRKTTVTNVPNTMVTMRTLDHVAPIIGKVASVAKSFATVKEIAPVSQNSQAVVATGLKRQSVNENVTKYGQLNDPSPSVSAVKDSKAALQLSSLQSPVINSIHNGMQLFIIQQNQQKAISTKAPIVSTVAVSPVTKGKSSFIPASQAPVVKYTSSPRPLTNAQSSVKATFISSTKSPLIKNGSNATTNVPTAATTSRPVKQTTTTTQKPTTTTEVFVTEAVEVTENPAAAIQDLLLAIQLQEKTLASLQTLRNSKQSVEQTPSPEQNLQGILGAISGAPPNSTLDYFFNYGENSTNRAGRTVDYYYDASTGSRFNNGIYMDVKRPFTSTPNPIPMHTAAIMWPYQNPTVEHGIPKGHRLSRVSESATQHMQPSPVIPNSLSALQSVTALQSDVKQQHSLYDVLSTTSNPLQSGAKKSIPASPVPTAAQIASQRQAVMDRLNENLAELNDMVADMQASNPVVGK